MEGSQHLQSCNFAKRRMNEIFELLLSFYFINLQRRDREREGERKGEREGGREGVGETIFLNLTFWCLFNICDRCKKNVSLSCVLARVCLSLRCRNSISHFSDSWAKKKVPLFHFSLTENTVSGLIILNGNRCQLLWIIIYLHSAACRHQFHTR